MDVRDFVETLDAGFFTGVPDSQLKALCGYLIDRFGISSRHMIAANEGNCAALAAGYYLATGKVPVVYMQNSGIGNMVNPAVSLLNEEVYGIPCIFVVGWRGEPGEPDEPQHIFQGRISGRLLEDIGLHTIILSRETSVGKLREEMAGARSVLEEGRSVAFLVRKGALSYDKTAAYKNGYGLLREQVIEHIVEAAGEDVIVSTTGKASRELFEIREKKGQGHEKDFLTVGSMGHSSSIALAIALNKPGTRVWCIDGDGAALMHMGSMAVIGSAGPSNMVHILINNEAHETVGGMPTVSSGVDWCKIAEGCGYPYAAGAETYGELDERLLAVKSQAGPAFLEVKCAIGARADLGRPTTGTWENKEAFMGHLKECGGKEEEHE